MEPTSDGPDNAVPAGVVFFGNVMGRPTRQPRHTTASTGCLVSQAAAHVCRCARRGTSALLDPHRFSRLPSQRPGEKTTRRLAGAPHLCTVPGGLMAKVELMI